ncbi:AMP-binding protein, partial [Saccharothrix sp. MB29]|nr:AMP-binding protein [Saccharothrix sp. MB29]
MRNLLLDMAGRFPLTADDRLLAVTTIGFDIAGLELLLPLLRGATVVLSDEDTPRDPARLAEVIAEHGVTAMQATPALWRALAEHDRSALAGLRVLVGGEELPRDLAVVLADRAASVTNLYGPTETTVWSTAEPLDPASVTIGRPIANTRVHVLD